MFSCVYGLLASYREEESMCFIGLIGKEQLPCCISTTFLSSTASAYETALRGALAVPFFVQRKRAFCARMSSWTRVFMFCFVFCFVKMRAARRAPELSWRQFCTRHAEPVCAHVLKYAKDLNKNAWVCKNVCVPVLDGRAPPFISREERRWWILLWVW